MQNIKRIKSMNYSRFTNLFSNKGITLDRSLYITASSVLSAVNFAYYICGYKIITIISIKTGND